MAKASLVYHGPHDEVEVPDAGVTAQRDGEPVEVDEKVAKSLLEQADNWKRPETKAQAKQREAEEAKTAEQDAAAEKAAAEARDRVKAEQAKRDSKGAN